MTSDSVYQTQRSNATPHGHGAPLADARRFLAALFGERPDGGRLTISTIKGARVVTYWPDTTSDAAALAIEHAARLDVYFGCGLRREILPKGQRGKDADVATVTALWADLDVGTEGHKAEGHPATVADALEILNDAGLPPSIVVGSGGGIHPYLLLAEPVATDVGAPLLQRWHLALSAAATARGYRAPDNVADPARILRVPGTINHKDGGRRAVELLHLDEQRRYTVAELDEILPALPVPPEPTPTPPGTARPLPTPMPADADADTSRLVRYIDVTAAAIARTPAGERGSALHSAACRLGSKLAGHGCEHLLDDAMAALHDAARLNGLDEYDGPAKVADNIRRGIEKGRANPERLPDKVHADASSRADAAPGDNDAGNLADLAAAALMDLAAVVSSLPEATRRRATVTKLATVLLSRIAASGRPRVSLGFHRLAHLADCGHGCIAGALPALECLGFTVQLGSMASDGSRVASLWQWSGLFRKDGRLVAVVAVVGARECPSLRISPGAPLGRSTRRATVAEWDEHGAHSLRLARRGRDDDGNPVDGKPNGCGLSAWAAVGVLRDASAPMTAADLAAEIGISTDTAGRILRNLAARGLASVSKATSTGGRPAAQYEWIEDAATVAAEIHLGKRLEAIGLERLRKESERVERADKRAADLRASGITTATVTGVLAAERAAEMRRWQGEHGERAAQRDAGQTARAATQAQAERMVAERANDDARDEAADTSIAPCYACGARAWWTRPDGGHVCGVCHPRAAAA